MSRIYRDNTEEARILRTLASSPQLTTGLLPLAGGPPRDDLSPTAARQRALSRIGNEIRRLEKRGMVERAGRTAGGWQQGQILCWRITPAGREQITWWDEHDAEAELAARRPVARQEERLQRKAQNRILLGKAAAMGPLHRIRRQQEALELREAGCSYQEIGDALGVSRQCALNDVRNSAYQPRSKRWERRLAGTPLAGLAEVTLTEW